MKISKNLFLSNAFTFLFFFLFISADSVNSKYYGIIRSDTSPEKYIELAKKSEFDCVGRYSISEESEEYAVGTLIASRWVLTAAHFVQDSSVWNFGERFYRTKRVIKHPEFSSISREAQWSGRDLALIQLDEPVLHIKPATRYYSDQELGKIITKIGYGYTGDGKLGLQFPRRQERRGGHNRVDAVGGVFENQQFSTNVMVCDFDSPEIGSLNRFGSPIPLTLEIGGSKGDSGGGAFIEEQDQFFLIGVVSGALNREIKYGSVLALARVSTANEWIDSIIYSAE